MVVGFMQAPGSLTMKKSSNLTKISDDNAMYSFEGAEYTVYDDDGDEAGTLTTDADGNSDEIELAEGSYTVKETKAPAGYAKDSETYTVTVESEEETSFKPKETPITAKIDILIEKNPEGYPHNYGEGDASLKGAVFKVEYYDSETAPGEAVLRASKNAKATWYFVTDAKGQVSGSDPTLSKNYDSDKLYKDADGNIVWPLGSYVVAEVKAPTGYILNGESTFIHVYEDGTDKANTKGYNKAVISDEVIKGGVRLAKVDRTRNLNVPKGDATLKNAEFTIYNKSEHSVIVNGTEYGADKAVLTIKTDEILSLWDGIGVVLQAPRLTSNDAVVHPLVGSSIAETIGNSIVVELLVINLHKLCWIGDGLIILDCTAVGTPLHIDVDNSIRTLSFLSGNQNHTSGTTGAIKGCRGSIFQDGDTLNILLRNVRQTSAIGSTIYDNKRLGVGIHRCDTTDVNTTLGSTWLTT